MHKSSIRAVSKNLVAARFNLRARFGRRVSWIARKRQRAGALHDAIARHGPVPISGGAPAFVRFRPPFCGGAGQTAFEKLIKNPISHPPSRQTLWRDKAPKMVEIGFIRFYSVLFGFLGRIHLREDAMVDRGQAQNVLNDVFEGILSAKGS
jgi:hypothetical protein